MTFYLRTIPVILAAAIILCTASVRAQSAIEGAKKEGHVVFYASMETQSTQRLTSAFEKKYPFIKVDPVRIGSEKMAPRLIAEAQARKTTADVVHQSAFDFYGVFQKGIFDSYVSPERQPFLLNTKTIKGFGPSTRRLSMSSPTIRGVFPTCQLPRVFGI